MADQPPPPYAPEATAPSKSPMDDPRQGASGYPGPGYPTQPVQYPPQAAPGNPAPPPGYPAQPPVYPPQQPGYPPQQPGYPQQQPPGYPPQQPGYPPQQPGYPPQQGYPQQKGYAPAAAGPPPPGPAYTQQPGGYTSTNTTNTTIVVTQQPTITATVVPYVNDYMGLSIFSCLCCCWIIGLIAIVKSFEARNYINAGDYVQATRSAIMARNLSYISIACAVGIVLIAIIVSAV